MTGFFARATWLALFLVACGDDYVQPPPPTRPGTTADAGGPLPEPILPADGALTLETAPATSALGRRTTVLHATVGGGAGPYRIAWRQTGGVPAWVVGSDTVAPVVTLPDVDEATELPFTVTAIDAYDTIVTAKTTVRVSPNELALATTDRVVEDERETTLHATVGGQLEGLTFAWTQLGGPRVTILDPTSPDTRVVVPFVASATEIEIEARAANADGRSVSKIAKLLVRPNAPIAAPGPARVLPPGVATILRVSALGGTPPYRWAWTQTAGAAVTLANATTDAPSFTTPATPGELAFAFTATDASNHVASATVPVNIVSSGPGELAAFAPLDTTAPAGALVQLSGAGRSNSGTWTHAWNAVSGPSVTLGNVQGTTRTFIAPASGTVVYRLSVTDGATASDEVAVTVAPQALVVDAGPDLTVQEGDPVALSAASRDARGARTWSWTQRAGTSVAIADAGTSSARFVAPAAPGR